MYVYVVSYFVCHSVGGTTNPSTTATTTPKNGRALRFLTRAHAPTKSLSTAVDLEQTRMYDGTRATATVAVAKRSCGMQINSTTMITTMMMTTVSVGCHRYTFFVGRERPSSHSNISLLTRADPAERRVRARNNDSHQDRRRAAKHTTGIHHFLFILVSLYFFKCCLVVRLSRDHADVENRHHTPHNFLLVVDTGTFRVHRRSIL